MDVSAGMTLRAPYPFIRDVVSLSSEDGYAQVKTWRPGVRMENIFVPPDSYDTECFADGAGEIILSVVSVHKPGKYPTRVFFTRRWQPPTGREFGKSRCWCVTLEKFRRLAKGYAHPYTVKQTAEAA